MNTKVQAPALISPPEAANMLGLSLQTLAVWRCEKRQPLPYVKVGRLVRYRLVDVEAFISRNLQQAA